MTKEEARQRVKKLRELINYHRYLYHVLDKQEIPDEALDSLKKELFDLEQQYPELITSDSPTQRIGGKPLKEFKKIKHPERMLSLNDSFSQEDMTDWLERVSKLLTDKEKASLDFYSELKLDGLAMELIYKDGLLTVAATRGDGSIGEDVTQNLKTVEAIPLQLRSVDEISADLEKEGMGEIAKNIKRSDLKEVVVRGEVFLTKKEFENINKIQAKKGLPLYANPRNVAAGSIRQLDPRVTASRHLDSNAYELLTDFGQTTHEQKHKILKALGFKINTHNKYCKDLEAVFEFHKACQFNREKLPYEIDGVVVIINSVSTFNRLGVVGKTPRGAIAYKFPLRQATTRVQDIVVQVGRTGAITPVAHLEPVNIGGTTITRATLHNEDEIKRLGLKIGDTVIVGRAGDVIPDIIKVLVELRTGKERDFKMPKVCPSCGAKLEKSETEALLRCPNPKCFARQRKSMHHFASRTAFDMRGIGPKIIDKLLEEGLIQDPADLFNLKEGDVVQLERFAEKSAQNLIAAIQGKKEVSLQRFIYALGIRNVGEETARDLANKFESIDNLEKADFRDLENIKDIGPIVSKSIADWFSEEKNKKLLAKLKKAGIKVFYEKPKLKNQKLKGKTFVFTGELDTMSREQAKEEVAKLGGEASESVSGSTSFVVVGEKPGSKMQRAQKLGVKVIGEEEFLGLIK